MSGVDLRNVTIDSVDLVAAVDVQSRGQPAIAQADVNDQPALDSGSVDQLSGFGR